MWRSNTVENFVGLVFGILFQLSVIYVQTALNCTLPQGWESKTIAERMREATAEIVIKGTVLDSLPASVENSEVHPAVIEVLCVFKGPRVSERITVAGFGKSEAGSEDCIVTDVRVGDTYIIIMMPYEEDRFRIVEVNNQVAAQRLMAGRYGAQIEASYGCQEPFTLPPTTPMPTTLMDTTEMPTTWEMSTLVGDNGSTLKGTLSAICISLLVTFVTSQIIMT